MIRIFPSLNLICAVFLVAPVTASAVTIDWTPVGNPGNAPDPTVMSNDGTTGYGSVGYDYNIDKYDVTNSQYVEMLNAKDPTGANTLGLYNSAMTSFGGINYNAGAASGSKYSVISGDGNHPVNEVSWFCAVRFANWLNNGQGNGDTETGAYTLLGGTQTPSNDLSITRNAGATIFLPSENEWYKAAYYNPATSSYFQYPTGSNAVPAASGPTATPNSANYNDAVGATLTDVGAYSGTMSPYGAFDMGGNVVQWNESLIAGSFRGARSGAWNFHSNGLLSSDRGAEDSLGGYFGVGFRVASVPDVANVALTAGGGLSVIGGVQGIFSQIAPTSTFTSTYQTETSQSALQTALGATAAGAINFGLAGTDANGVVLPNSAVQFWDMHFTGTFTGDATITVHFDPTLIGTAPLSSLQIWHYTGGAWVPVANETINTLTDTITFTTDSFSPFILGSTAVPEPSTFILAAFGGLALLWYQRRRNG